MMSVMVKSDGDDDDDLLQRDMEELFAMPNKLRRALMPERGGPTR